MKSINGKESCEELLQDINSSFVELSQKFDALTAIFRRRRESRFSLGGSGCRLNGYDKEFYARPFRKEKY